MKIEMLNNLSLQIENSLMILKQMKFYFISTSLIVFMVYILLLNSRITVCHEGSVCSLSMLKRLPKQNKKTSLGVKNLADYLGLTDMIKELESEQFVRGTDHGSSNSSSWVTLDLQGTRKVKIPR